VETGFPKRSCSIKKIEPQSIQPEAIKSSRFRARKCGAAFARRARATGSVGTAALCAATQTAFNLRI
jgi:hypothetical protein